MNELPTAALVLPFWSFCFRWKVSVSELFRPRDRDTSRESEEQVEQRDVKLKGVCQAELSMPRELSKHTPQGSARIRKAFLKCFVTRLCPETEKMPEEDEFWPKLIPRLNLSSIWSNTLPAKGRQGANQLLYVILLKNIVPTVGRID